MIQYVKSINGKLVKDEEARTQIVQLKFKTIEEMKTSNLKIGDIVHTFGYHNINDGGGANYFIREKQGNETIDNGIYHDLSNGMVAELLSVKECGYIDVRWFGAFNDGLSDSSDAFKKAIEYSNNNRLTPIRVVGQYAIKKSIEFIGSLVLHGEHVASSRILMTKANQPQVSKKSQSKIIFDDGITGFNITGLGSTEQAGQRETSLDIQNIEFTGGTNTIVMDIHAYGCPSRPSVIKNVEVHGVHTFIQSIWNGENQNGTLIYNLDIGNCNMYSLTYAFNIVGQENTTPTLGGLNIHDNVIEQSGGFILKNLFGCNRITNNLMESLTEQIYISINKGSVDFSGNYFEANTCEITFINETYDNSNSVLIMNDVYIENSDNMIFKFRYVKIETLPNNLLNVSFAGCYLFTHAYENVKELFTCENTNFTFSTRLPDMTELAEMDDFIVLNCGTITPSRKRGRLVYSNSSNMTFNEKGATYKIKGNVNDFITLCFWKPFGGINLNLVDNSGSSGYGLNGSNLCVSEGFYAHTFKLSKALSEGYLLVNAKNGISKITFINHGSNGTNKIIDTCAIKKE